MRSATSRLAGIVGLAVACATSACKSGNREPLRYPPVVVTSPLHLAGAVVLGASRAWYVHSRRPVRYGDPMPVKVTMYCLQGTTRRGRYVRAGIVAADPQYFPLSRYVELYVGTRYAGRFLVDDTGRRIRGARIDVWTPVCREAQRFGMHKGTAVLVPRGEAEVLLAGTAKGR